MSACDFVPAGISSAPVRLGVIFSIFVLGWAVIALPARAGDIKTLSGIAHETKDGVYVDGVLIPGEILPEGFSVAKIAGKKVIVKAKIHTIKTEPDPPGGPITQHREGSYDEVVAVESIVVVKGGDKH